MKQLILFITFFSFFLKTGICTANIGINPFYIIFDANTKNRSNQVHFSNIGTEEKTYRIKLINYRQLSDGTYKEVTEQTPDNLFAEPYLAFSPNQTTLAAQESQIIRLQRKPMVDIKDGEYVSHLLIQEVGTKPISKPQKKETGIKIDIKALYGVTIPIIIQKGNLTASAKLGETKIKKKDGKTYLETTVKRSGTKSLFINITVKNKKEKIIGSVNNFRVYLSTPTRSIDILLEGYKEKEQLTLEFVDVLTDETIFTKTVSP